MKNGELAVRHVHFAMLGKILSAIEKVVSLLMVMSLARL
jgi:hypothetical protein